MKKSNYYFKFKAYAVVIQRKNGSRFLATRGAGNAALFWNKRRAEEFRDYLKKAHFKAIVRLVSTTVTPGENVLLGGRALPEDAIEK